MKKILSIQIQLLALTSITLLLSTCSIKEDWSDCPETRIIVRFDEHMFQLPPNEHTIDQINIYVFHPDGLLFTTWQGAPYNYHATAPYIVPIDLPEGIYQLIAWTNLTSPYKTIPATNTLTPGKTRFEDLQLHLDRQTDNTHTEDIPDLHYGTLSRVKINPSQGGDHIIQLLPDTYRINLTLKGHIPAGNTYQSSITDNNTHFDFNNRILPDAPEVTHTQTLMQQDNAYHARMRILPLTNDHSIQNIGKTPGENRSPQLTVENQSTHEQLFKANLITLIEKAYQTAGKQVDFDQTYQFDIILSFDAEMNVTVSVNGWQYNPNGIEL